MALPLLKLELNNNISGLPEEGKLVYVYNSFYNLQNPNPSENQSLLGLNISKENAGIEIDKPVQLETEVCYDDSVNLIITDKVNPPKIVNSRFYQTSSLNYKIADRKGNLDTNIYSESDFKIETSLIKRIRTVVTLSFLGISDGGKMPVGNYTFYFKLADADGNESDFVSESGKVVCHMGSVNNPESIRGGMLQEDSNKLVKFKLQNLDLSYDYINVYYTKSTGDPHEELVQAYKVDNKFKITNNDTEIAITGYEEHVEISIDDINIQYASFDSVKTITNCQNISFAGNITNNYDKFKQLEELSLRILPTVVYDEEGIGNLDNEYSEQNGMVGGEYYNVDNIYYKLGYWDEEIYRFGIVYILNDYTLSPVFNIRGKKVIDTNTTYTFFNVDKPINYGEDYIIENSDPENPENIKGVFKIDTTEGETFNNQSSIKPLGIRFNFDRNVLDGLSSHGIDGLKKLTKGFFIVRQKRVPTILAQAVGIGTSTKAFVPIIKGSQSEKLRNVWFSESFLKEQKSTNNTKVLVLGSNYFPIGNSNLSTLPEEVKQNALLCPEATLKPNLFGTFFNSSEFVLIPFKYTPFDKTFKSKWIGDDNFTMSNLQRALENRNKISSSLTLITPGISRLNDGDVVFSSKAGDELIAYKHSDPILGDFEDMSTPIYAQPAGSSGKNNLWNTTATKLRGIYNTYIGSRNSILHGEYYNIYQKGYNFEENWKNYFKIRYNDSSPFFPVSDRIEWTKLNDNVDVFRGDCYINTYTHRINWNFIDPELPTNKKIIDGLTWFKNFKISPKSSILYDDEQKKIVNINTGLSHKKLLPIFTYIEDHIVGYNGESVSPELDGDINSIKEPTDKKYKKYADANGEFGYEKINRPDVNAVPLGHWVTFKICSNINLAMRDLDFGNPAEEALHKKKRGFYPIQAMDKTDNLPESNAINLGISKSIGDKYYFETPDVPFTKTNFSNRIHYSLPLQSSIFTNGNRIFENINYQDYTLEYGSITKLIEWYGTLIVVMEHGTILIPVNERALMTNASGESVYVNTDVVLPKNPLVLSNSFGSLWSDSVIKTSKYVYGIDTVAKKIWRTNGKQFEIISDMKIQKFLNENILLKETDRDVAINKNSIKTHYNAFKEDVLFVYVYGKTKWHLCWNEKIEHWITRYTWFPEFSENINNIFYTFANRQQHKLAKNKIYKHGFSGYSNLTNDIEPTKWYDEQHSFEFEFLVNDLPGTQKIYDNLKIVSNNVPPDSFVYEIVGDGFDWSQNKDLILKLNESTSKTTDVSIIGFGKPFPWLL